MKKSVYLAIAFFLIVNFASADTIELKHNFFTGWKFSTDGVQFNKVGFTGKGLIQAMEGNEEAQNHVKKYGTYRILGAITGWPGGFLVGWVAGKAIVGKYEDSKDTHETMLMIGVPLMVSSIVLEAIGNSHLKKSVRIYNEAEPGFGIKVGNNRFGTPGNRWFNISLVYHF